MSAVAFGQGGPPLLTDDPGTPGNHHWEVNAGYTIESRRLESGFEAPILDINYGWGDRVQLKLELPWVVERENGKSQSALGNTLLGVKWRFYENKAIDLQLSSYPQLELNSPGRALERGLVERGPGVLLPLEITKKVGPIEVNGEGGYWFQRTATRKWIAGLAVGRELNHRIELLAEVHSIGSEAGRDCTWDVGGRVGLLPAVKLLLMGGRSFSHANREQPGFIGYFGLQFLLPHHNDHD